MTSRFVAVTSFVTGANPRCNQNGEFASNGRVVAVAVAVAFGRRVDDDINDDARCVDSPVHAASTADAVGNVTSP